MFNQSVPKRSLTSKEIALQFGRGKRFEYDRDATVLTMIEHQVKNHPDNIAIRFQRQKLTYKQFNEQANQLAHYLVKRGVQPGTNVAIYLEPSIELAISVLAVLKAGGCYVPLDINYPIERLNYMLENSAAVLLLTQSKLIHKLNDANIKIIAIDKQVSVIKKEKQDNLKKLVTAEDSAYIIYTSGSTGTPKGIAIHHRAINNHMIWMQDYFKFNSTDIILLKTPLSFDPSVWEFFLPLYSGAQLVIAPTGAYLNPESLIKLINQYQITTIQFVPSLLHEFLKHKKTISCRSLQRVFVGGEPLGVETKKMFFEKMNCQLHNVYGPTEATIEITSHTVIDSLTDINTNIIGKPIYNTELYVLDEAMNLVNIGEEGELYIGGDSLSKGYYNNKKTTQEKFLNNPFCKDKGSKIYRTGDIVKWLENGSLVYVGRNNDQIKINGVRIEPSELISYILNNHLVSQCIVTKKIDDNHHAYLACYLIPQEGKNLNILAIKDSLKSFFPRYMLPKCYMPMTSFPLTVNGKVDISALPDPKTVSKQELFAEEKMSDDERKLLMIWRKLLMNNSIQPQDNFFEVGGHSLLAFQLLIDVKSVFKTSLHIKDIFLYPTVSELAKRIIDLKQKRSRKNALSLSLDSLIPLQPKGDQPPLFLIHPIGGTVFWYSLLAHVMGESRPVYGIQDPAIELQKEVFNSISEMADFYISLIQKVQPHGPYLIGGASFGATVAIEIADKLQKRNEKIALVPILDGWAIYPNTLRDDNYFKESMRRQHADIEAKFAKYNLPKPEELFVMQWHRLGLLWNYELQEIQSPIVLFKSQEILPAFKEVDKPLNHWEKFKKQPFESYLVPGDHETMFQVPHVYKLAKLLKQCLDNATKGQSSNKKQLVA